VRNDEVRGAPRIDTSPADRRRHPRSRKAAAGPEFLAFNQPGFAKIAWNLAERPAGRGMAVLSTETRAAATDAGSRERFRRYGPWIRLIRSAAHRLVQRDLARSRGRAKPPRALYNPPA
jgi:hypothetical protein